MYHVFWPDDDVKVEICRCVKQKYSAVATLYYTTFTAETFTSS